MQTVLSEYLSWGGYMDSNQRILLIDKNDKRILQFGQRIQDDNQDFFIRQIDNKNVCSEIIVDKDFVCNMRSALKKLNKEEQKKKSKKKEIVIFDNDRLLIGLKIVSENNKIKMLFEIKNITKCNLFLCLDEITINHSSYQKSLMSDYISSIDKMQECSFEFVKNTDLTLLEMVLKVKILDNEHPVIEKKSIRFSVGSDDNVLDVKVCNVQDKPSIVTPLLKTHSSTVLDYHSVIVYSDIIRCQKLGHILEEGIGIVQVCLIKNNIPYFQRYEIPIYKCDKCKVFYITEEIYQKLSNKGNIIAQVISQKQFDEGIHKGSNYGNIEHLMHKCGYNVVAGGLKQKQRRALLKHIISSQIVTKEQAINHLKDLIKMNYYNFRMENAISKWEKDIEFLKEENIQIGIKTIMLSDDIKKL